MNISKGFDMFAGENQQLTKYSRYNANVCHPKQMERSLFMSIWMKKPSKFDERLLVGAIYIPCNCLVKWRGVLSCNFIFQRDATINQDCILGQWETMSYVQPHMSPSIVANISK